MPQIELLAEESEKLCAFISKVRQNNSMDDEALLNSILKNLRHCNIMFEGFFRDRPSLPSEMVNVSHMPIVNKIFPNEKLEKQLVFKRTRKQYGGKRGNNLGKNKKEGQRENDLLSKVDETDAPLSLSSSTVSRKRKVLASYDIVPRRRRKTHMRKTFTPPLSTDTLDKILDTVYGVSSEIGINLLALKSLDPYITDEDAEVLCQYEPNFVRGSIQDTVIDNYLTSIILDNSNARVCCAVSVHITTQINEIRGYEELINMINCKDKAILHKNVLLCPFYMNNHWVLIILQFLEFKAIVLDPFYQMEPPETCIIDQYTHFVHQWSLLRCCVLTIIYPAHVTQGRDNVDDSGILICSYAERYLAGIRLLDVLNVDVYRQKMYQRLTKNTIFDTSGLSVMGETKAVVPSTVNKQVSSRTKPLVKFRKNTISRRKEDIRRTAEVLINTGMRRKQFAKQPLTPAIPERLKNSLTIPDYRNRTNSTGGITLLEAKSLDPYLSESDFKLLKDLEPNFTRGWVRGSVIDSYSAYLTSLYKDINLFIPTTGLISVIDNSDFNDKLMDRILSEDKNVSERDMILCPYNNHGHWTLIAFQVFHNEVMILDPLVNAAPTSPVFINRYTRYVKKWNRVLGRVFKILYPKHAKQEDAMSCGVFVCCYADRILSGTSLTEPLNTDEYRIKIYHIVTKDLSFDTDTSVPTSTNASAEIEVRNADEVVMRSPLKCTQGNSDENFTHHPDVDKENGTVASSGKQCKDFHFFEKPVVKMAVPCTVGNLSPKGLLPLLKNGNLFSNGVRVGDITNLHVRNTSAFDALFQIVFSAAIDSKAYARYMTSVHKQYPLMNAVHYCIGSKITQSVYRTRADLLLDAMKDVPSNSQST